MRVLVTGAAGFIGSAVVRSLVRRGHEVTAAELPGASLARLEGVKDVCMALIDPVDQRSIGELVRRAKPDAVAHLAWYVNPKDYLWSFENTSSLDFTLRLAQAAFEAGCRKFVGTGTCLEYARADRPVTENDPTDPTSFYASTKLGAFLALRALAALHGAEIAWARIFHLFGPGEHPSRLVPSILASLRRGSVLDVTAGEQVRDYLHVEDVASGIATLLQPGAAGAFNVCSGVPRPLRDVVLILGRLTGREGLVRLGARPYGPDEEMYLAGDSERLRSMGWTPEHPTLEAALEDVCGRST